MQDISALRPSPIAGLWYSNKPDELRKEINHYLTSANIPDINGEILGVISPHAGHRYSGKTAGHAFRTLSGYKRDLIVIISPLHSYSNNPISTSAHQAYATPLGNVPIRHDLVDKLAAMLSKNNLSITKIAQDREHSLEIILPFLQCSLENEFDLLPLMVHSKSNSLAQILGRALAEIVKDFSTLIVASTDLSHFYPQHIAAKLDQEMLAQISSFDPEGVLHAEKSGAGFACGAAAVAAVLWATKELGANAVEILDYSTSGEVTGDLSSVVGYGSGVILRQ